MLLLLDNPKLSQPVLILTQILNAPNFHSINGDYPIPHVKLILEGALGINLGDDCPGVSAGVICKFDSEAESAWRDGEEEYWTYIGGACHYFYYYVRYYCLLTS